MGVCFDFVELLLPRRRNVPEFVGPSSDAGTVIWLLQWVCGRALNIVYNFHSSSLKGSFEHIAPQNYKRYTLTAYVILCKNLPVAASFWQLGQQILTNERRERSVDSLSPSKAVFQLSGDCCRGKPPLRCSRLRCSFHRYVISCSEPIHITSH